MKRTSSTGSSGGSGNGISANQQGASENQKYLHYIVLLLPAGQHAYTVEYTSSDNQNSDPQTVMAVPDGSYYN